VNINCRGYDFTLLFEQVILGVLPSITSLLWLIPRLAILQRSRVKSKSLKLAICKSLLLFLLFVLQIILTVYQVKIKALHTKMSIPAAAFNLASALAAIILSFLKDQRTVQPSDTLIVYFSALSILYIPYFRTLWLIPSITIPRGLFTTIYIIIVLTTILESTRKINFLQLLYKNVSIKMIYGFWGRNLFVWVLPLFWNAYTSIISLDDLPDIDSILLGDHAKDYLA
ncbi:ABC transporter integral membrane type 1, partial [Penicillium malachiteum]